MNRLRLQLIAVLVLVALLPAVPAVWTARTLFTHGLDPEAAPNGPTCVLFVGRLVETKGVLDAVEAWKRAAVDLPLVSLKPEFGAGKLHDGLSGYAFQNVLGWCRSDQLAVPDYEYVLGAALGNMTVVGEHDGLVESALHHLCLRQSRVHVHPGYLAPGRRGIVIYSPP